MARDFFLPFGPGGAANAVALDLQKREMGEQDLLQKQLQNALTRQTMPYDVQIRAQQVNPFINDEREANLEQTLLANQFNRENNPLAIEANRRLNELNRTLDPYNIADVKRKDKEASNPLYRLMNMPGQIGQEAAIEFIKQNPEMFGVTPKSPESPTNQLSPGNPANRLSSPNQNNFLNRIQDRFSREQEYKQSIIDRNNALTKTQSQRAMPTDEKQYIYGIGAALGFTPDEVQKRLEQGYGVRDLALEAGADPDNLPEGATFPTTAARTQLLNRRVAEAERSSLQQKATSALGKYARKIYGFSPEQVIDAITGKNIDDQAKFLAARALMFDQAGMALRMGGGSVGVNSIKEFIDASLGNSKILEAFVTPEIYTKMQEYMSKWIGDAFDAGNKAVMNPVKMSGRKKQSNDNNFGTDPLGLK